MRHEKILLLQLIADGNFYQRLNRLAGFDFEW